ncbi:TonB-dependent siderophore receptor [Leptolyngbyaceae cyanobacterium CCMR0082]|uniref:TonB-dependent siderophore receptor n=2 Tax=Adonisia TaxID=2950183 RepID=A0A6M0S0W6_9CYAN|nr:TonB-dependent siderophore receptor [Adonisia turfae CCMR0082]
MPWSVGKLRTIDGLAWGGVIAVMAATPVSASVVPVSEVRVNPIEEGVEIVLVLANGGELEVLPSQEGASWIADIPNAQLSEEFEQIHTAAGIAQILVQTLNDNTIRVTVVGEAGAPVGVVEREQNTLILTITPVAANPLRLVVTGETAGSDYFAPRANTATRTDTPLLDIPQAVQVIPGQVLDDRQVSDLDEALENVSGVVADNSEGAGVEFSLRGFQGARVLRNGFNLAGGDSLSSILTLPEVANLEQIEVLKGPSSILYGEIQPGGVINLVTKRPTAEPLYNLELQAGSRSLFRPQLDISDQVTPDVRYRLNFLVERDDSFRDFGQDIDREFVAPVVTWDISDNTNLTVDLEYLTDERPFDTGLLALGDGVIDVPQDRVVGELDDVVERSFFSTGYELNHRFSENWSVRNAFRYSSQHYDSNAFFPLVFDETTGLVARLNSATDWYQDYAGVQTDLVGKFETGGIAHTLLFGVDYSRSRADIVALIDPPIPTNLAPINIFNPVYGLAQRRSFDEFSAAARIQDVNTTRFGVFLQDQIDFSDALKLVAGIRYETVDQELTNGQALFDPTGRSVSQNVDDFTPRLGVVYQPIPELAIYGSYSRSFVPSGSTDIAGDFLEPEAGEGYEIGLKTELWDQQLIATLAYFDITKRNVATPDPNAPAFLNAAIATGEQRSQGIELDIAGEILPGWNLIANYAYIDARITEDNQFPEGNGLVGIPEHSAGLWTTYRFQTGDLEGLGLGFGFNYMGKRPGDLADSFRLDDYFTTDAAISYAQADWKLALNFKNLFDIDYIQGTPISRTRGIEPGEPFTVVGSISFQF